MGPRSDHADAEPPANPVLPAPGAGALLEAVAGRLSYWNRVSPELPPSLDDLVGTHLAEPRCDVMVSNLPEWIRYFRVQITSERPPATPSGARGSATAALW